MKEWDLSIQTTFKYLNFNENDDGLTIFFTVPSNEWKVPKKCNYSLTVGVGI